MINNRKIARVCFNFLKKCNMSCAYCYCPFNNENIDLDTCKAIIKRCKEIGVSIITFSGGDPFLFKYFPDLLILSQKLNFIIQVDTNGLCLSRKQYQLLDNTISILTLPIESYLPWVHNDLRAFPGHYDIVLNHIKYLKNRSFKLKINTMVCPKNINDLHLLSDLLNGLGIDIWSVYQYWPIKGITEQDSSYIISEDSFRRILCEIESRDLNYKLEYSSIKDRTGYYLLVSHSGEVYCVNEVAGAKYIYLGSIFKDDTISKWIITNKGSIHPNAIHRFENQQAKDNS